MKFYVKVFLATIVILAVAFSAGGSFLIASNYDASVRRETERSLEEYQLLKFAVQSSMINAHLQADISETELSILAERTADLAPAGSITAVHLGSRALYSGFPEDFRFDHLQSLADGEVCYLTVDLGKKRYIVVSGRFSQYGFDLYLTVARDISVISEEMQAQISSFTVIYVCIVSASAVLIFALAFWLTRPIRKLTRASRRIRYGDYSERVDIHSGDEIGDLAASFNSMAAALEKQIAALEKSAQEKEDFVANFAHELKTPLTSVIGYADMLSKKQRDPETVYMAASYILSEGKRLEAMALKLMDLTVLHRHEFEFVYISAKTLLVQIESVFRPLMAEKQICFDIEADEANILTEKDLVKTLIINLVDNAVKSGADHIVLSGEMTPAGYRIGVADNGCGIPQAELDRITEAFYMVDKSRARKQHGAGIGLSLASKIAELHDSSLIFNSVEGRGTSVYFILKAEGFHEKQTD